MISATRIAASFRVSLTALLRLPEPVDGRRNPIGIRLFPRKCMTGNQPRKPGRCDHGLKPSVLARMIWLMHAINKREIAHGIGRSLLVRHVLLRLSNPLRE